MRFHAVCHEYGGEMSKISAGKMILRGLLKYRAEAHLDTWICQIRRTCTLSMKSNHVHRVRNLLMKLKDVASFEGVQNCQLSTDLCR